MNSTIKKMYSIRKMIQRESRKGFVLPFTMLISALILFVTMTSMNLLSKQLYFSRLYKDSQTAYYAADDAVNCTIVVDDAYTGSDGFGIFPASSSTNSVTLGEGGAPSYGYINNVVTYINTKNATNIVPDEIKCGQAVIFDTSPTSYSQFSVSPVDYVYHYTHPDDGTADVGNEEVEYGQTSTFKMHMDLGLDPVTNIRSYRCAKVTVNKTPSFRQIIAQGYSSCDNQSNAIERAVVNTTITK